MYCTSLDWTTRPLPSRTLSKVFLMSSPSMPRLQSSTRIVRKPNSKECIAVEAAKTEKNLKKVHLKTASSTSSLEHAGQREVSFRSRSYSASCLTHADIGGQAGNVDIGDSSLQQFSPQFRLMIFGVVEETGVVINVRFIPFVNQKALRGYLEWCTGCVQIWDKDTSNTIITLL